MIVDFFVLESNQPMKKKKDQIVIYYATGIMTVATITYMCLFANVSIKVDYYLLKW